MKLFMAISLCVFVLAFIACAVIWSIKRILEWSDDIAYWWKELKNRHQKR